MTSAKIYFADKSTVTVSEGEIIIPVVLSEVSDEKFTSIAKPIELYNHIHDGLIPALTTAFCSCSFFYIGRKTDTVYGTGSIIKIENL